MSSKKLKDFLQKVTFCVYTFVSYAKSIIPSHYLTQPFINANFNVLFIAIFNPALNKGNTYFELWKCLYYKKIVIKVLNFGISIFRAFLTGKDSH